MSFTDVFGGSPVQPSVVAYAPLALSANISTFWPALATGVQQPLARIMDVTPTGVGFAVLLPVALQAGAGQDVFFNNPGAYSYTVQDSTGSPIAVISPGQQRYIYLTDNTTAAGTWRSMLFAVGASSPDASALAGSGLKAIGATLNQSTPSATISTSTTFTSADRAKMYVNIGGAITCTLPLSSTVSNDFFMEIRNQGTGTLTLACTGGELIDGSASIVLQVNESCFFQAGVANWYTVGRGRNTQFNFTQLLKNVTGGTTTLSLTEASNVVQTYSGTAVSANTVVLPSVVQVYYISNQVLGGFTFTIQSPTPGATLVLPYGQNAVVFCDGVNVINASTAVAGITSLLLLAGSVSVPSLGIAAINNGLYAPTSVTVAVSAGGVNAGTFSSNGYNGPIGGDTAFAGAFTSLTSTSGALNGSVGATTPSTGAFTSLASTSGALNGSVGATTPSTGAFTTLSATSYGTAPFIAVSSGIGSFPVAQGLYIYYSGGGVLGAYSNNSGTLTTLSLDGSTIAVRSAGSTVGNFSTTGLAVTGSLSATGIVSITATYPEYHFKPAGWATDAYIQAGVNSGATGVGDFFTNNVPTGKGYSWAVNNVSQATLDTSGNLGVGVTPSAWYSTYKALQISTNASLSSATATNDAVELCNNAYRDSTGVQNYKNTGYANMYQTYHGEHRFWTAPSGTAGNPITFTQSLAVGKGTTLALEGATSAAGTGVAFPSTQLASSDPNTLDDYEEGTWTPTQGGGLTVVGAFTSSGSYTKIGNLVTVHGTLTGSTSVSATVSAIICNGLPFLAQGRLPVGALVNASGTAISGVNGNPTTATVYCSIAVSATVSMSFSLTYMTS